MQLTLLKLGWISSLMLAACAEDARHAALPPTERSEYLIDQIAVEIVERNPSIVIVNEIHEGAHQTRYISACVMEAVGRLAEIEYFGAESFAIAGPIDRSFEGHEDFGGFYVDYPHFDDLLFAADEEDALIFGYDPPVSDFLSADEVAAMGLADHQVNRRDAKAAQTVSDTIGINRFESISFLHVGGGHGNKSAIFTSDNDSETLWLAGQLLRLGHENIVSLQQRNRRSEEIECSENTLYQADFSTGTLNCVENPDYYSAGFDMRLLSFDLATNENGYIAEPIPGCNVRVAVELSPPSDEIEIDAPRWTLTAYQRTGYGRRAVTWRGDFDPEESSVHLISTGAADLVWVAHGANGARELVAEPDFTF